MAMQSFQLDPDIVGVVKANVKLNELQNPDGDVTFSEQEAVQFVIEKRTDDPTAADGRIWLRTDL